VPFGLKSFHHLDFSLRQNFGLDLVKSELAATASAVVGLSRFTITSAQALLVRIRMASGQGL